ncbi:MAG: histidine phosphatase family protein [Actinobacteria bacterium]|nr:histidine phosphatase family protein [Actinomycetota bacterium]
MTAHELDSTQAVPQPNLLGAGSPDMCEVLLIRHGRSADVVPGSPESADPPLHELGVVQAAALAKRLAPLELHGVYSSHLRRAIQTAQPLADQSGLELETHVDLEEIRLGDWGLGEFRRRAAAADPEWLAWSLTGRWDGIPGGEGDEGLRGRVATNIALLAERHRGQRIAVVVHSGVINAYVSHLLDVHRSLWMVVENTSITLVRLHRDAFPTIVSINDCHHLYDPVLGPTG